MKTYHIAVIAGDGIGPEVIREAMKVLRAVAELDGGFRFAFTEYPWGCEYYLKTGEMMPENGLELLRGSDAILLGAVGSPGVPDHISLRGILVRIRQAFDQYINLRPVRLLRGTVSPLRDVKPEDVDMLFVRENSEGEPWAVGKKPMMYRRPSKRTTATILRARSMIPNTVRRRSPMEASTEKALPPTANPTITITMTTAAVTMTTAAMTTTIGTITTMTHGAVTIRIGIRIGEPRTV